MTKATMVCPHCGQDIYSEHRTKEESIADFGAHQDMTKAFVGALPEFIRRGRKAQAEVDELTGKLSAGHTELKKALTPAERAKAYRARKKGEDPMAKSIREQIEGKA